jgi:polar amino acid transport system substrate-binding protein
MKITQALFVVILCIATVFVMDTYVDLPGRSGTAIKESTYDRVARTGTVRCGYSVWDPLFYIDPKTNEKKGIFHDMMEEVGKRLGLKIVWQEELGWGMAAEAVKTGRVDMACAGYWLNPARIKTTLSSASQLYSPLYIWMRQDDTRAFTGVDDLNADQYTVVSIDGSAEHEVMSKRFPKTKVVSLPEMDTGSDELENLTTHKADFLVSDPNSMTAYIANNPGKIKNAFPRQPLTVFPNVMLLPPDDLRFKQLIDDTLRNIEYDGVLDSILKNYHMEQGFLRNPSPVSLTPQ